MITHVSLIRGHRYGEKVPIQAGDHFITSLQAANNHLSFIAAPKTQPLPKMLPKFVFPSVSPRARHLSRLNPPAIHLGQVPPARVPTQKAREDHRVAPRNVRVCGGDGRAAVRRPRRGSGNARRGFGAACRGDVGVLCLDCQIGLGALLFSIRVVCRVSAKS